MNWNHAGSYYELQLTHLLMASALSLRRYIAHQTIVCVRCTAVRQFNGKAVFLCRESRGVRGGCVNLAGRGKIHVIRELAAKV